MFTINIKQNAGIPLQNPAPEATIEKIPLVDCDGKGHEAEIKVVYKATYGTTADVKGTIELEFTLPAEKVTSSENAVNQIVKVSIDTKHKKLVNNAHQDRFGWLVVEKAVNDENPQDFRFDIFKGNEKKPIASIVLDDDSESATPRTEILRMEKGHYSIKEMVPQGWEVTSASCHIGSKETGKVDLSKGEIKQVEVIEEQVTKCFFFNAPK
jgi:hypothetical protein